jgi:hypothetical protein
MIDTEAFESDDDQERRGDACFLAKEQSWRTAWRARSLLSRTNLSTACSARGVTWLTRVGEFCHRASVTA